MDSPPPLQRVHDITSTLATRLSGEGLDLVGWTRLSDYNNAVDRAQVLRPWGTEDAILVVVGNSKQMWPAFSAALKRSPERLLTAHPLDHWIEEVVGEVSSALPWSHLVKFGHDRANAPMAIQCLAELAGLAHLAPCHLSVHPIFGPWIGLRAAFFIKGEVPDTAPQAAHDPCADCAQPCMEKLSRAIKQTAPGKDHRQAWRAWLAVRTACPIGTEHIYDDAQIRYHYTGEIEVLKTL